MLSLRHVLGILAFASLAACGDDEPADTGNTNGDHFPGSSGPVTLVCSDTNSAHNSDDDGDGFTECDGDCDDTDAAFYPGAPDVDGDQIDNGCDNYLPTKT